MTKFGDVLTTDEVPSSGTTILNGTGPPADALGADGNYYLDTTAKILYGPKGTAPVYGADQIPVVATPSGGAPIGTATLGLKFRTLVAGRISALRYYRMGGIGTAHTMLLQLFLQSTQAELGRATVNNSASAPAGWINADLVSPVVVTAGTDYRVGYSTPTVATINAGYTLGTVPTSSVPASVTINGDCLSSLNATYPGTDISDYYFAAIVFQPQTSGLWPVALKSAP